MFMLIDQYDPYITLASEIVLHNFKRYISAAKRYSKYHKETDLYEMEELKRWFYSDKFPLYCTIHPDQIMKAIQKELSKNWNTDSKRKKDNRIK